VHSTHVSVWSWKYSYQKSEVALRSLMG